MKGKKGGGGGDAMTIIFSILLYAIILIFFSILMLAKGCTKPSENEIYSEKSTILEMDSLIMGYLRTDVEIEGKQYDVAELIGRYMAEPDKYRAQLTKETEAMLAQTSLPCPSLSVYFVNNAGEKDGSIPDIAALSSCTGSYRGGLTSATSGEMSIYRSKQKIPLQKNLNGAAIIEATSKGWA
jgi:hypothetical protein